MVPHHHTTLHYTTLQNSPVEVFEMQYSDVQSSTLLYSSVKFFSCDGRHWRKWGGGLAGDGCLKTTHSHTHYMQQKIKIKPWTNP